MSAEELDNYEAEVELSLYREYRDVVSQFSYVVETDRRFYLANGVELIPHTEGKDVYYEVRLSDAWVWDMYLSLIHISEPTRREWLSRMPSSA